MKSEDPVVPSIVTHLGMARKLHSAHVCVRVAHARRDDATRRNGTTKLASGGRIGWEKREERRGEERGEEEKTRGVRKGARGKIAVRMVGFGVLPAISALGGIRRSGED